MITVMTATYNRAHTLLQLYESLCNQTQKSFEWIIIDDGSMDETEAIVNGWRNANIVEITYVKKQNGGKHRAINDAVKIAKHDWFFVVDSDDFLTLDAIEQVSIWTETIEKDESFAGVAGLKAYASNGQIIGQYPKQKQLEDFIDATNLQRKRKQLLGDKAEVYRTAILRKYLFPEYEGENFISESVVWDNIAQDGYKLRWFNKIICKCEYLEDGLTKSGDEKIINNFEGFTHYIKERLALYGLLERQSAIEYYFRIAQKKGLKFHEAKNRLDISTAQMHVALYLVKPVKSFLKILRKKPHY